MPLEVDRLRGPHWSHACSRSRQLCPCVLYRLCFFAGVRLVQTHPSSSPLVLVFFRRRPFFLFLPFQGSPAPGKVCWLVSVFSWFLLFFFAFPVFCSCQVTFISFSFSSDFQVPSSSSLPDSPDLSCSPCLSGVCMEHLNGCNTSPVGFCNFHLILQGDVANNQGPRPTKLSDCMGYRA